MKVAIIIPKLIETGPIIVAKNLVEGLLKIKGVQVEVFCFSSESSYDIQARVTELQFFKKYDFSDFDIIHSHMFLPDLYLVYHGIDKRKKIITTLHQFIYPNLRADSNYLKAKILNRVWLFILNRFHAIAFLSNEMKLFYNKALKTPKGFVAYNGINLKNQKAQPPFDTRIDYFKTKKLKVIGTICLLTKRKGTEQIIRFLEKNKDYCVVIIGDGKERKNLENLALHLGVIDRVLFKGFVSNAYKYLSLFDLFFVGSRSEGFGLSLVEAGLFEVPIVCSRIDTFIELYSEEEVDYFELDNQDSLEKAIFQSLSSANFKTAKMKMKILETFSIDKMCMNYLNIYKSLLLNN